MEGLENVSDEGETALPVDIEAKTCTDRRTVTQSPSLYTPNVFSMGLNTIHPIAPV